jgi:hypothetical protein
VAEGQLAEREGRLDAAARSYLDCLRFGGEIQRGGLLIHGLVGVAIQSMARGKLEDLADRLPAPTAARAAREMAACESDAVPYAAILAGEGDAGLRSIYEILRAPGGWARFVAASRTTPRGPREWLEDLEFSLTPKTTMIRNYQEYMDAQVANARRPYYAPAPVPAEPKDPLNRVILPVFSGARFVFALRDARSRIVQTRLACRVYLLERGSPPPDLKALVPRYLPSVPPDPFSPNPLVYRGTGGRIVVYSRGPDGDDDGGKDIGPNVQANSNGDLVRISGRQ